VLDSNFGSNFDSLDSKRARLAGDRLDSKNHDIIKAYRAGTRPRRSWMRLSG
jgi:hypothetical protein